MNSSGFVKYACSLVALATCAACSGGSAAAPSTGAFNYQYIGKTLFVNGTPITAARLSPMPRFAELVPELKSEKYEYIFNYYDTYAGIYDYPKSTSMIGQITGAGGQGCTNTTYGYGKGIIWNPGRTNGLINEYKVPKKLIKSLYLDYKFTSSCAMNASGDLAVGILLGNSYGRGGQVVIFKNATGKGTVYNTPLSKEYFDGYDPSGNLFADGFIGSSYNFGLVELPKGSSKFVTIATSSAPEFPGSVQWDGKYVSVFDQLGNKFYQYTISGTTATLEHTISITGPGDCAQTWIVKGLVYCADYNGAGDVLKYPAGGSIVASFKGNFDGPLGVTAATK